MQKIDWKLEVNKMFQEEGYYETLQHYKKLNRPFALATVIAVTGSASARPGSKAIFNEEGKNVWGWVGGGCAESFVAKNAMESMKEGLTRIVKADLDDEIMGLGMPCGGIMDVYIEPQHPKESITIKGPQNIKEASLHLARNMGFDAHFSEIIIPNSTPAMELALYNLAHAIAKMRNENFMSLKENRRVFPIDKNLNEKISEISEVLIVGSSRITEEMAKFAAILKWKITVYGWNLDENNYPASVKLIESDAGFSNFRVLPGSVVLIASHHKGDHDFIKNSIAANAQYVGLISSTKRAGLVLEHLKSLGMHEKELSRVHAPAGLEMKCNTPSEIALSCFAEIIELKNEGQHA